MSPQQLKALLNNIKQIIPQINYTKVIVDESQLTKSISEISQSDNILLVGILPNYGNSGANADSYKENTFTTLLVVEKSDYSSMTDNEFIDLFERTYQCAKLVKETILNLSTEGCSSFLRNIDANSISIDPEWKLADCNGYSITFDIV